MNRPPVESWEEVLRSTRFDLPDEGWQRIENGLRERIRAAERADREAALRPSWSERLRGRLADWARPLFRPIPLGFAGAIALLAIAGTVWLRPSTSGASTVADLDHWEIGARLSSAGRAEYHWGEGRTELTLDGATVRLETLTADSVGIVVESGRSTFAVDHRRPNESYQVGFGQCRLQVVGTRFSVSVSPDGDSARVLEGRVRVIHPEGEQFLDAGEAARCGDLPAPLSASKPVEPGNLPAVHPVPGPSRLSSSSDAALARVAEACAAPRSNACLEARANFVHRFPRHASTPVQALAWAELARARGDVREAATALTLAARPGSGVRERALLVLQDLRLRELGDASGAAAGLDSLLPRLEAGSARWAKAWSLRREAAVQLGQTDRVQEADQALRSLSANR